MKYYVNFLIKRWLFSILDFDKKKTILKDLYKNNKFYILDKTKHNYKNFSILRSIIPIAFF
jgi:hypothetical protein